MHPGTTYPDELQQQASNSTSAMPYPPLPASPTLTNPDMILPEYERASSPDRSQSPLHMWKPPLTLADMQYHIPLQNAFPAGPITPTTPIIYGNGTMLSDIGEVTEVESAVGGNSQPPSPSRSHIRSHNSSSDAALRSSPTAGTGTAATATLNAKQWRKSTVRERSDSIESTSTVTTAERPAPFADFDDAVSVGDSNFQGDDEESVAESFADDSSVHSTRLRHTGNGGGLNEDNRFSTSSIGRRAELILANAKRRLTTMEGNLSRARSSLYINSAHESDGSLSAPSPPFANPNDASGGPNPTVLRTSHSRMPSDNLLPIDTNTSPPSAYPRRSASALGAAGGYRQPLNGSKSLEALKFGALKSPRLLSLDQAENNLEPLSEDGSSSEPKSRRTSAQLDGFLSPTFGPNPDHSASRPGSAAQMRELKEQMLGLKGKISTLREQARADSLKRRSLQSLRTPSPFTHARIEQWYAEPQRPDSEKVTATEQGESNGEAFDNEGMAGQKPGDEVNPDSMPHASKGLGQVEEEAFTVFGTFPAAPDMSAVRNSDSRTLEEIATEGVGSDDSDDMCTEDGIDPIDGDNPSRRSISGYTSESGDSLYHDAHQTPLSHEDREDAFDYEHFFLHSAMGTISQQQFQRRESVSSKSSVETTRGPITTSNEKELGPRHHTRKGSGDTTSTTDTFATADEGKNSPEGLTDVTTNADVSDAMTAPEMELDGLSEFGTMSHDEYVNGGRVRRRHNSVVYRPTRTSLHRPSVSSFESTGTNRSFPLVNVNSKVKINGGILTPQGSPDQELKNISDTLMNETASMFDKEGIDGGGNSAVELLHRDDQLLVQRLVASLGRCVLGLGESGRASPEHRMMRRRLDEARRILEGGASSMAGQ
ncbi:hypothetical protein jhhlp_002246 [Lomentospora prolificans]|uniref:Uncharacterized protein n=1 Tax=Lomentospora prolificans TaxID=41688 RepID=A0A2N3NDI0_9PEZI|nr:hypothetical protein jhhlp_002246 [Lomentospora prolificans]